MNIRFSRVLQSGLLAVAFVPGLAAAQSGFTSMAKPIDVAAGLQVNRGATDPKPNTVVFDGPHGDGRGGSKGILLKSDLGKGSTWSFKYIRNHGEEGSVQIIHPVGRGQGLITIRAKEIRADAPKLWAEAGWGGGDTKDVNEKAAFKKVFPLKDDQEYSIVCRVTPGGSFDLFIDGELVASGRTGAGKPLNLNIPPEGCRGCGKPPVKFGGAGLPLIWSAGWAGVIVGPVDGTRNDVKNLQFTPAAIDMPGSPARQ